ncbi:MAG: UDP-N-acetylglucosamine 2-epimerase, partial [Armatimonadota bacterium]
EAFTVHGLYLYDAWRPDFFTFFLDDLVALACVVRGALRREQPSEVYVAEDAATRFWWTGRERFADVARALAGEAGPPVRVEPGPTLRGLRDGLLRLATLGSSAAWSARACARGVARRVQGRRVTMPASGERPRVLITLFGASELDIVEDLCGELEEAGCGGLQIVDLGFEQTGRLARQRGWAAADVGGHMTPRSFVRGLCAPLLAWSRWGRVARDADWQSSFSACGAALWPAAAPRAWAAAIAEMTRAIVHGSAAHELLARADPDVIVSFKRGASAPAGFVLAARRCGVPTVYIQHGLLSETFRTQPSLPHARFLVFSEHARDQIAASGVSRDAIEVVGHAGYDGLVRGETVLGEAERGRSVADGEGHVLLLLTQPDEGLRGLPGGQWIEHAFAAAAQIDDCRLVVKLHPRDTRASAYAALAARTGADARIVSHAEAKLPELWPLCDAVVIGYSTAAFEAIIHGKPVVSINLMGEEDCYPFAASGAALAARRASEVLPALRSALTDEPTRRRLAQQREEFLRRHVGPLDGQAAKRMAAIIVDMARRRIGEKSGATLRPFDAY